MWDVSSLTGSFPGLGVLQSEWEGLDGTAKFHPFADASEGFSPITWPMLQMVQLLTLVGTGMCYSCKHGVQSCLPKPAFS